MSLTKKIDPDTHYSLLAVGRLLNRSKRTIYRWLHGLKRGDQVWRLHAQHLGGTLVVTGEDLIHFINNDPLNQQKTAVLPSPLERLSQVTAAEAYLDSEGL